MTTEPLDEMGIEKALNAYVKAPRYKSPREVIEAAIRAYLAHQASAKKVDYDDYLGNRSSAVPEEVSQLVAELSGPFVCTTEAGRSEISKRMRRAARLLEQQAQEIEKLTTAQKKKGHAPDCPWLFYPTYGNCTCGEHEK